MTTIQTTSTTRTTPTDDARRGARAAPNSAPDAPGFSQLLDNQLAVIDPNEESRIDEPQPDEDTPTDEPRSEENEQAEPDTGTSDVTDLDTERESDQDHEPVFDPKLLHSAHIRSARDLDSILNNAAQIDLSRISSEELSTTRVPAADVPETPEHLKREPIAHDQRPTRTIRRVPQTPNTPAIESPQPGKSEPRTEPAQTALPERSSPEPVTQAQPVQAAAQSAAVSVAQTTQPRAQSTPAQSNPIGVVSAPGAVQSASGSSNTGNGASLDLGAQGRPQILKPTTQESTDPHTALRNRVVNQVSKAMASVMKEGGGSMKLRLSPEHLGELNIKLELRNGVLRARVETSTNEATKALEEGLPQLRAALEARGVRVDELTIQQSSDTTDAPSDPGSNPDGDLSDSDQRGRDDRQRQDTQTLPEDDSSGPINAPGARSTRTIWTPLGLDAIA